MKLIISPKFSKNVAMKIVNINNSVTGENRNFLSEKIIDIAKIAKNRGVQLCFAKSENPLKDELIMQVKGQESQLRTIGKNTKNIFWKYNKIGEAFIKFTDDSKANLASIEQNISRIKNSIK